MFYSKTNFADNLVYDFSQPKLLDMIRGVFSTLSSRFTSSLISKSPLNRNGTFIYISKPLMNQQNTSFTTIISPFAIPVAIPPSHGITKGVKLSFLKPQQISAEQIRTVIKFSLKKGNRKSVRAVTSRFFRLHWGAWIRTMAGRHKKLWKKSGSQRNRLKNHVFCNATQSRMLDKMVNKFWRKPKYYIDDPYEPYHKRENFYITQRKPWRPEGVDYE